MGAREEDRIDSAILFEHWKAIVDHLKSVDRKRLGTQADIAQHLRINASHLSNFTRQERNFPPRGWDPLATLLGHKSREELVAALRDGHILGGADDPRRANHPIHEVYGANPARWSKTVSDAVDVLFARHNGVRDAETWVRVLEIVSGAEDVLVAAAARGSGTRHRNNARAGSHEQK